VPSRKRKRDQEEEEKGGGGGRLDLVLGKDIRRKNTKFWGR